VISTSHANAADADAEGAGIKMALGTFSASGFQVSASNALDLIAGTQAASAGMVASNIQSMSRTLDLDLRQIGQTVASQGRALGEINQRGFSGLQKTLESGVAGLEVLSGVSIAVQAMGFAVVAKKLGDLQGDVRLLHRDMVRQGEELAGLQRVANAHSESLVDFSARTLLTNERILETLVSSRTTEAQQLIRQAWENLRHGYEDDAFTRLVRSLEYDNTIYFAHAELGKLYEGKGDLEKAEDHLRRATRFGVGVGAIEGFAHLQYSGFLERRARLDEAVREIDAALAVEERPEWLFASARLLAMRGRSDEACRAIMRAVQAEPALFLAAMGSEEFAPLRPALTRSLMELDQGRRAKALDLIGELVKHVEAIRALEVPESQSEVLRASARQLLEAVLTGPFAGLAAVQHQASTLLAQCGSTLVTRLQARAEETRVAVDRVHQALRDRPSDHLPPGGSAWRVASVMLIPTGVFVIGPISASIAYFSSQTTTYDSSGYSHTEGSSGLFVLFVYILFAAGPALFAHFQASANAKELDPSAVAKRSAYLAWRARAEGALKDGSEHRSKTLALFKRASESLDAQPLRDASAHVTSFVIPELPPRPAWMEGGTTPS